MSTSSYHQSTTKSKMHLLLAFTVIQTIIVYLTYFGTADAAGVVLQKLKVDHEKRRKKEGAGNHIRSIVKGHEKRQHFGRRSQYHADLLLELEQLLLTYGRGGNEEARNKEEREDFKPRRRSSFLQPRRTQHLNTTTNTTTNTTNTTTTNTTSATNSSSITRIPHNEEYYKCNEVIATIRPSESYKLFDMVMNSQEEAPEIRFILNSLFAHRFDYGVQVKTVCAACNTVMEYPKPLHSADFQRYCGDEAYGYDKLQSGLVMIPLVEDQSSTTSTNSNSDDLNLIPLKGILPGFIHARSTKIQRFDIPSQLWNDQYFAIEIMLAFVATATRGAVSLAPDFMGFGYSQSVKSYLVRDAYVTSTLPLWMKVSAELRLETSSKTILGDAVAVEGYSEGGYAAVAIAEGIHKALNVNIIQVRSGSGAYDITKSIMAVVERMDNEDLDSSYCNIGVIFGASYSSTNTHVANYNMGQNLLNAKYMNESNPDLNVISWLEEPTVTSGSIDQKLSDLVETQGFQQNELLSELWNPDLISFMQTAIESNVSNPCSPSYEKYQVGAVDKLCEAFIQNSLTEVLYNADYHIHICHSEEDELVSYNNVPNISKNPKYLTLSTPSGNHFDAAYSCFMSDLLFFTSSTFRNYIPKEQRPAGHGSIKDHQTHDPDDESNMPKGKSAESTMNRLCSTFLTAATISIIVFLQK